MPQYPKLLEFLEDIWTRSGNMWRFWNIFIALPENAETVVRLWHNTRVRVYLRYNTRGALCLFRLNLKSVVRINLDVLMFGQSHESITEHRKQCASYKKSNDLLCLYFRRARLTVFTNDIFQSKLLHLMHRIDYDSIWFEQRFLFILSGNHVLRIYRVFFSIEASFKFPPAVPVIALYSKKKVRVFVRFNLNLEWVTRKMSAVVADQTKKKNIPPAVPPQWRSTRKKKFVCWYALT